VTEDWVPIAADRLVALADDIVARTTRFRSRLDRALVLDALAMLAGELRDEDVRVAKRSTTWASIGRAFGVSQQAASKRWG